MQKYLTFDVGGLSLKYAVIDDNYNMYEEGSFNYELPEKEVIWTKIRETYLAKKATFNLGSEIFVATAGVVDRATTNIFYKDVDGKIATKNATVMLGLPNVRLYLENDAKSALLAEYQRFATKADAKVSCVLFSVGTSLGATVMINNEVLPGHAGEIGLGTFNYHDQVTIAQKCGMYCLVKRYQEQTGQKLTGAEIWARAQENELAAVMQTTLQVESLATLIVDTALLLNISNFSISGAISTNKYFMDKLILTVTELVAKLSLPINLNIYSCHTYNYAARFGVLRLKEKN